LGIFYFIAFFFHLNKGSKTENFDIRNRQLVENIIVRLLAVFVCNWRNNPMFYDRSNIRRFLKKMTRHDVIKTSFPQKLPTDFAEIFWETSN